jgi:hypothetical protein
MQQNTPDIPLQVGGPGFSTALADNRMLSTSCYPGLAWWSKISGSEFEEKWCEWVNNGHSSRICGAEAASADYASASFLQAWTRAARVAMCTQSTHASCCGLNAVQHSAGLDFLSHIAHALSRTVLCLESNYISLQTCSGSSPSCLSVAWLLASWGRLRWPDHRKRSSGRLTVQRDANMTSCRGRGG